MQRHRLLAGVLALALVLGASGIALSHCEIPCGIYNDSMRIVMLREDITTVEKSMKQITELGAQEKPNWNQLVRWVTNKEEHANKIQEVVTQYFMTQRVKVPAEGDAAAQAKYVEQVTILHQLLVTAMKMKQTTDLAHVKKARELVDEFVGAYFSEEDQAHLKEHHD
jgi:nickel superoxide dismutase